jgi:hypothetical protein
MCFDKKPKSYAQDPVNEDVVAGIWQRKAIRNEPNYVNVFVS